MLNSPVDPLFMDPDILSYRTGDWSDLSYTKPHMFKIGIKLGLVKLSIIRWAILSGNTKFLLVEFKTVLDDLDRHLPIQKIFDDDGFILQFFIIFKKMAHLRDNVWW